MADPGDGRGDADRGGDEMTQDQMPACQCSAHPSGDDRKRYMAVVEETRDHVVFCCRRCSEITHTAVIQVRTLKYARERARHTVSEQRRDLDPRLIRMMNARKRGGMAIREMKESQ